MAIPEQELGAENAELGRRNERSRSGARAANLKTRVRRQERPLVQNDASGQAFQLLTGTLHTRGEVNWAHLRLTGKTSQSCTPVGTDLPLRMDYSTDEVVSTSMCLW